MHKNLLLNKKKHIHAHTHAHSIHNVAFSSVFLSCEQPCMCLYANCKYCLKVSSQTINIDTCKYNIRRLDKQQINHHIYFHYVFYNIQWIWCVFFSLYRHFLNTHLLGEYRSSTSTAAAAFAIATSASSNPRDDTYEQSTIKENDDRLVSSPATIRVLNVLRYVGFYWLITFPKDIDMISGGKK